MAKPIRAIKKTIRTEEEKKKESLDQLASELADHDAALKKTLELVRELHDSGILEAAHAMLKAKTDIAKIAVEQATRKPVTNMIHHVMGAAGVMAEIEPELTKKLLTSVAAGMEEAKDHLSSPPKVGLLDLLKAMNDPDVNRAVGFGIRFLKGMGKGLKE
ncbi:hypothetical protein PAESOLCIP111_04544 [Paenibacillus solanacearum]|uniref:DUF1641 domain-containing protein n=1 Tax=Paenibacillus solanacearum TaxID=2048548 RepID=A0A916K4V7_9BACL|nr:DUF1641 domain-containing protein [Paenibacillus solanacearum]CAG7643746.1 hypothetical protein PAESOLCIP111_04544 [Paenibacillus solanacearum]